MSNGTTYEQGVLRISVAFGVPSLDVSFGYPIARKGVEEYTGPYEVIPTQYVQELATEGKQTTGNIVIRQIPSNYGLIAWNGSVLTVS